MSTVSKASRPDWWKAPNEGPSAQSASPAISYDTPSGMRGSSQSGLTTYCA